MKISVTFADQSKSKQAKIIVQSRNSRSSTTKEHPIIAASSSYKGATFTKTFELNRSDYAARSTTAEARTEAILYSTLTSLLRVQQA